MKKAATIFLPYLLLVTVLTIIITLAGRGIYKPRIASNRLVKEKAISQVIKEVNQEDQAKKSRNKKVLNGYIAELALADTTETTDTGISDLPAEAAATQTPPVQVALEPAAEPVPEPEPTLAPPEVIASNTDLTAEQAESLQGLYPGISEGWTIELYEKVADEFYARYARWGGDKEPAAAAFQEFLAAIDGEKTKAGLSFPRSWLGVWRNGDFKR